MNIPELKNKIKIMLEELLPVLQKNNNAEGYQQALFSSYNTENNTYVKIMDRSENELFESPQNLLLAQKNISDFYSEEFVRGRFVNMCHKLIKDSTQIDQNIEELISFYISNKIKTFFVLSEIENIRVNADQKYQLADSTITILKTEDLPSNLNNALSINPNSLLNKSVVFTRVKAGEMNKAKEIARHNFQISFNLLRLHAPNFKPALKGSLLSGKQMLVAYDEDNKEISSHSSHVGDLQLNHAYLDNNLYAQLKSSGIEELKKTTSISRVVKESLYWFGLGLDETYPSVRLLNFVTILEATLKRKDEVSELRKTVSERGALLLYDKFEERKTAVKQLKEIYDLRSKVVHTGILIDDKIIASLSKEYARRVLIKIIQMSKDFDGDFDKLITHLDDLKLEGYVKWRTQSQNQK